MSGRLCNAPKNFTALSTASSELGMKIKTSISLIWVLQIRGTVDRAQKNRCLCSCEAGNAISRTVPPSNVQNGSIIPCYLISSMMRSTWGKSSCHTPGDRSRSGTNLFINHYRQADLGECISWVHRSIFFQIILGEVLLDLAACSTADTIMGNGASSSKVAIYG